MNKPDIVDVISKYVKLEKAGELEYKGLCPFHEENTASFFVNVEKQVYNCFGCESCGDVIDFIQKHNNVDFKEATKILGIKTHSEPVIPVAKLQKYLPPKTKKLTYSKEGAIKYSNALLEDEEALKIVIEYWGITKEVIQSLMIGLKVMDGKEWVVIPYIVGEDIVGIKYRTLPVKYTKKFRREKGFTSILYNFNAFNIDSKEIYVTEGESKAMGCIAHGIENVVGNPIGAGSWDSSWNEYFEKYDSIFLLYDTDAPGKSGALNLADKLGGGRCIIVNLPENEGIKDVNDYFKIYTKKDLVTLAHDTERKKSFIYTVDNAYEYLRESLFFQESVGSKDLFPWRSLDESLNLNNGDVVTVSGVPGTGKTSFLLNIALHLAKKDIPVLFACLEMLPHILLRKAISSDLKIPYNEINIDIVSDNQSLYSKLPLYLGYIQHSKEMNITTVEKMIRTSVRKYGIKYIFFDHLDYLCRSIKYVAQETAKNMQTFKTIAMQTQSKVFLVQHPRKVDDGVIMTMNDLKNSGAIAADSDRVILMHRSRIGIRSDKENNDSLEYGMSPYTIIRIEKGRLDAEKQLIYYFEGERSLFRELTEAEERIYRAQRQAIQEKKGKYLR